MMKRRIYPMYDVRTIKKILSMGRSYDVRTMRKLTRFDEIVDVASEVHVRCAYDFKCSRSKGNKLSSWSVVSREEKERMMVKDHSLDNLTLDQKINALPWSSVEELFRASCTQVQCDGLSYYLRKRKSPVKYITILFLKRARANESCMFFVAF